jgi:hypothetical protein
VPSVRDERPLGGRHLGGALRPCDDALPRARGARLPWCGALLPRLTCRLLIVKELTYGLDSKVSVLQQRNSKVNFRAELAFNTAAWRNLTARRHVPE